MRRVEWLAASGLLVACLAVLLLWPGRSDGMAMGLPYLQRADGAPVWRSGGGPDLIRLDDVALRDQENRPVRLSALRGQPVIVDFVVVGCEDVCPPKRQALQALLRDRPDEDLAVVTLVMNRRPVPTGYLRHLLAESGQPDPRWQYWQGRAGEVLRYCRTIPHVGPRLDSGLPEPAAAHSDNVLLLDGDGYCRGVHHAMAPMAMAQLRQDLDRLAARP